MKFELITEKKISEEQKKVVNYINDILKKQNDIVLLGATGTGKTFSVANIIKENNKQTLVLAHNKTLANQLYVELKSLFPNNRVEYYISNFDFYQPEAYNSKKDIYIEKRSVQNWQIEMMRNAALNSLTTRDDTIVVASVAAIYGHREPIEFINHFFNFRIDEEFSGTIFISKLIKLGYKNSFELKPGDFFKKGDVIEIAPSWTLNFNIRISFFGDYIEDIAEIDSMEKTVIKKYNFYTIYPSDANVISDDILKQAIPRIENDLRERLDYFDKNNKLIEYQRLKNRVNLDIEQLKEFGMTSGIENYSIYFEPKRKKGEPPYTLLSYFKKPFLTIIDESHITIPQLRGMYEGDRQRKQNLVDFGFRLPTALDNRPLKFEEFFEKINKTIYLSATPAEFELQKSKGKFVEQIIRPTGLLDPIIEIRKEENQFSDIIKELKILKNKNERAFISTTTKKLSENIASYLTEKGYSVAYLHSELKTFERQEVLRKLRIGFYIAIVGVNLLREGIDVPEISLMLILEADKEGFLRNRTSLIQMIGRAARNENGRVILYADRTTKSMQEAIDETNRRRNIQLEYNKKHNIKPTTIIKPIPNPLIEEFNNTTKLRLKGANLKNKISDLEKEMRKAAKNYDFEKAIKLRDIITELKNNTNN